MYLLIQFQLIYGSTAGLIGHSHPGFSTNYLPANELRDLANTALDRLNIPNIYTMNLKWPVPILSCPATNTKQWQKFPYKDWDKVRSTLPIRVGQLPKGNYKELIDMSKYYLPKAV